ncbi:glycosyltransferase [Lacibacter sp. MH-610]|uniref:glycosyltransferase n=1 Tax=Lacibacter sp. MH-610 TaxID=3020883 RepID=UPI0038920B4D
MAWLIAAILFVVAYCSLLLLYRYWLQALKPVTVNPSFTPSVTFTVLIPARNEEKNIAACLQSMQQLNYPKALVEIIVIDDFSEDKTAATVQQFSNVKLVQLKDSITQRINSYKKKAIEVGIQHSTGDYIVTTDADCTVPENWLLNFAWMIEQQQSEFIAAPVTMKEESSFIKLFQSLDFLSLQGITAASVGAGFHSMCNGANLCYSKKAFAAVDGFKEVDHIASGDDMLLMYKVQQQFPGKVHYCYSPGSIVLTDPVETIKDFFRQRIRWASKADKYNDKRIFWVLLLVYLFNFFLLTLLVAGCFNAAIWILLLAIFFTKTITELIFLIPVASFFRKQALLMWFPVLQPFHIIYTIIAGWFGKFGTYEWKGRKVK